DRGRAPATNGAGHPLPTSHSASGFAGAARPAHAVRKVHASWTARPLLPAADRPGPLPAVLHPSARAVARITWRSASGHRGGEHAPERERRIRARAHPPSTPVAASASGPPAAAGAAIPLPRTEPSSGSRGGPERADHGYDRTSRRGEV